MPVSVHGQIARVPFAAGLAGRRPGKSGIRSPTAMD